MREAAALLVATCRMAVGLSARHTLQRQGLSLAPRPKQVQRTAPLPDGRSALLQPGVSMTCLHAGAPHHRQAVAVSGRTDSPGVEAGARRAAAAPPSAAGPSPRCGRGTWPPALPGPPPPQQRAAAASACHASARSGARRSTIGQKMNLLWGPLRAGRVSSVCRPSRAGTIQGSGDELCRIGMCC